MTFWSSVTGKPRKKLPWTSGWWDVDDVQTLFGGVVGVARVFKQGRQVFGEEGTGTMGVAVSVLYLLLSC